MPTATFAGTESEAIEHAPSLSEKRIYATDAQRALAGAKLTVMLAKVSGVQGKATEKSAAMVGSVQDFFNYYPYSVRGPAVVSRPL